MRATLNSDGVNSGHTTVYMSNDMCLCRLYWMQEGARSDTCTFACGLVTRSGDTKQCECEITGQVGPHIPNCG